MSTSTENVGEGKWLEDQHPQGHPFIYSFLGFQDHRFPRPEPLYLHKRPVLTKHSDVFTALLTLKN